MIRVDQTIDGDTNSHERAADAVDHDRALIEQTEHDEYAVMLPEWSEGAHRVQYQISRFGGERVATCDCAHHQHRGQHTGQPCAHILTVALSDDRGQTTARDRPIRPYQYDRHEIDTDADDLTDDVEATVDQLEAFEADAEAVTDGGGRLPAGADGEPFGQPEAQL